MMEKVLIMGGSYFIGKAIVDTMKLAGYKVFTLNRGTRPAADETENIVCDRNDRDKMISLLKAHDFSIVIDVSGLDKVQAEILCSATNRNTIKKFFFISSSAVYDIENLRTPFKETDGLSENKYWTSYGKDKIEAEKFYSQYFSDSDSELVILRPPYVYGENNYAQRESFIFEHLYTGKPIILPASNPKLQFIYTADLANIILGLTGVALPRLSIFNVGNKIEVTSRQWVETCADVVKTDADIIMYDYKKDGYAIRDFFPFFDYDNVLDVSKINQYYNQETPFEVGLRNSFEWFVKNTANITFKENVSQNEKDILISLGYMK